MSQFRDPLLETTYIITPHESLTDHYIIKKKNYPEFNEISLYNKHLNYLISIFL